MVGIRVEHIAAAAKLLKSYHKPGDPLVLTNVVDSPMTGLVLSHPNTKAIATASYGVAKAYGIEDDDLTAEVNLAAIRDVGARIAREGKTGTVPLTADIQSGYGNSLETFITDIIAAGVAGCNIEDALPGKLLPVEEAVSRIKTVIKKAKELGVPDFVVNARSDVLVLGGTLDEVIKRGKLYLAAGATTVFVWGGGQRGVRDEEVKQIVKAFDGRLNVSWKREGGLSIKQLAEIGVARISMGPTLWLVGNAAIQKVLQEAYA